ncbi:MAG: hypothetical protein AB7H88_00810 [Vicinamibacterales bacterium]
MTPEYVAEIGTDHYLTPGEVAGIHDRPAPAAVWDTYRAHFRAFTGSRLDPQFWGLDSPIRFQGHPRVTPGTTVVIAGHAAVTPAFCRDLTYVRRHVSVWSSAAGAEALAGRGLAADLVIAQHRTDLESAAHVRHVRDRNGYNVLGGVPVVVADPRLPGALLAGVPDARLAGINAARGWGLWPATLTSLAVSAGASAVVLAGLDLATAGGRALDAVLGVIARTADIPFIAADVATPPEGWLQARLRDTPGPRGFPAVEMTRTVDASQEQRRARLAEHLRTAGDVLRTAAVFRSAALEARRHRDSRGDARLEDAWRQLMAWRRQRELRLAVQDGLGAGLLARAWREAPETVRGPLWRPVLLLTSELVAQGRLADARLAQREDRLSA